MYVFAPSSIRISDLCEVVRIQYRDNVEVAKFYEDFTGKAASFCCRAFWAKLASRIPLKNGFNNTVFRLRDKKRYLKTIQ
ncbi:hypothetical protein QG37_08164 [Candidozyma auris]|uniref:Uncharacterized protein n=1 Tax=Candidozyma auris TaxID=498019 RepID=A0A0L0NN55_CANAR|nr:hypothetical protein QG37_08164 [[Candida] auris]